MLYKICPYCGAYLDFGEKHDWQGRNKEAARGGASAANGKTK